MPFLIGLILVVTALVSVVAVMYFVVTEEPHEDEWFIPPPKPADESRQANGESAAH